MTGGVLSLFLWILVVAKLLEVIEKKGFKGGHATDVIIIVSLSGTKRLYGYHPADLMKSRDLMSKD